MKLLKKRKNDCSWPLLLRKGNGSTGLVQNEDFGRSAACDDQTESGSTQ